MPVAQSSSARAWFLRARRAISLICGVFRLPRAVDFATSRISRRIPSRETAARSSGISRHGQFGRADRLAHVPLAVFGGVDCEADSGGLETLTANFAHLAKLFGRQRLNEFFVASQRVSDGSHQFTGGGVAAAFLFDRRELFGAELAAFKICAEPFGAACQVPDVKTRRRHAMRRSPQLINRHWADGALDVFADVLGGAQEMADDRMDAADDATHPGLNHNFAHIRRFSS